MRSAIWCSTTRAAPLAVSTTPRPRRLARGSRLARAASRSEAQAPAQEIVGIEIAEDEGGVGHRGLLAAAAVAHGPGIGPRRHGPDAQAPARLVEPDDAAAAAPDGTDVDARDEVFVLVDHALVARHRRPAMHEPHVERRPAHVGGDHVLLAEDLAQVLGGEHAGHRSGVQGEERLARRLRRPGPRRPRTA